MSPLSGLIKRLTMRNSGDPEWLIICLRGLTILYGSCNHQSVCTPRVYCTLATDILLPLRNPLTTLMSDFVLIFFQFCQSFLLMACNYHCSIDVFVTDALVTLLLLNALIKYLNKQLAHHCCSSHHPSEIMTMTCWP